MNSAAYALPMAALTDYLEQHVAALRGPLTATKFKGGQSNPTYLLASMSGRWVLRRKPPGVLLASAHAVDREFRVLTALQDSAVPVARPIHLCTDDRVIGSMFYVMDYVDGRVFWDPALPSLAVADRSTYYRSAIATLAAIHAVDVDAVGLADYARPGNYFARQIKRWSEQYRASAGNADSDPAMQQLLAWLPLHCPADDGRVALVHGDFRFDNLMFDQQTPQVLAVVDWELSTLGHPLADLGYFCMALRLPPNPILSGLAGLNRDALGIPSEAALIDLYAASSGLRPDTNWGFHLAFNFFRLAAIAHGVYQRALAGNASSERALEAGHMARMVSQLGADAAA